MSFRAQCSGVEKSLAVWIKNRDSSTSLGMTKKAKAYARAGVDVALGNRLKRQIQSLVKQTHGPQLLGKVGGFGGLFQARFPGMRQPVSLASMDSVRIKSKMAFALDK